MNEGTRSGKSTIRLLGISAERPTNGLYLLLFYSNTVNCLTKIPAVLQWVYAIFAANQSFCIVSKISIGTLNDVPLNRGWETLW
jgi:hypothetical protein